jgi:hypothetical protein
MAKVICEVVGGSRLYGLETPDSDVDTRGVFVSTSPGDILGLGRHEVLKKEGADYLMFEFRHFLHQLRKTNTQAVELLFAEEFALTTPEFRSVIKNRLRLIDSCRLFSSLRGYVQNERRLANGERSGNIGSKRREQLERYGFSPKNFSHLLRLLRCGSVFFSSSFYPVRLSSYDPAFRDLVFSIKTEPWQWTKDSLNALCDKEEGELEKAFLSRRDDLSFDVDLANGLCLEFYTPFLC